ALVGTREFLEGFQSYFADIHGIENHRYGGKQIIQRKKGQKAYQYEKSGEGMFQILNILYGNANRYLERKYNLYLAVLNNCKDRYS
ncbi:hypothetical protein V7132_27215, partial [Priestia megaterium]|uniref:hypothetical protein n=1 Tax=Priestia megaterium TaxID=1404 RepID=UPI002FFE7231